MTPKGILQAAGKTDEIKALNVKLPDTPITFEQAFELAIEITKSQGHIELSVADSDETEMARRVYVPRKTSPEKSGPTRRDYTKTP